MVTLLSQRTAAITKQLRARAQVTKHLRYLDDTYEVFLTVREPVAWDMGEAPEHYVSVGTGRCKLYANGVGGPRMGDIIFPESPYRIRVLASEFVDPDGGVPDLAGRIVVVNNARVFHIDDLKVDDGNDLLADLYVAERPGASLPEVV